MTLVISIQQKEFGTVVEPSCWRIGLIVEQQLHLLSRPSRGRIEDIANLLPSRVSNRVALGDMVV